MLEGGGAVIAGIGVDCVQVGRVGKSIARESFCLRVFSGAERALWQDKSAARAAELAAGGFAAKEAFLKAAGRGLGGFALPDISALRQKVDEAAPTGKPYFEFSGKAAAYMEEEKLTAHLSISHDGGMAVAFVVLEKQAAGV